MDNRDLVVWLGHSVVLRWHIQKEKKSGWRKVGHVAEKKNKGPHQTLHYMKTTTKKQMSDAIQEKVKVQNIR